ncbi:MAG: DUF3536 domain-containing protein [Saprospiraceae bacterium]
MALADCLRYIDKNKDVTLTNYGAFSPNILLHGKPGHDNSSWSCVHGVERWRSDCGCNSGRPGWHQRWRQPLRETLDWLRDQLIPIYEQYASPLLNDPWVAREMPILT